MLDPDQNKMILVSAKPVKADYENQLLQTKSILALADKAWKVWMARQKMPGQDRDLATEYYGENLQVMG